MRAGDLEVAGSRCAYGRAGLKTVETQIRRSYYEQRKACDTELSEIARPAAEATSFLFDLAGR